MGMSPLMGRSHPYVRRKECTFGVPKINPLDYNIDKSFVIDKAF